MNFVDSVFPAPLSPLREGGREVEMDRGRERGRKGGGGKVERERSRVKRSILKLWARVKSCDSHMASITSVSIDINKRTTLI